MLRLAVLCSFVGTAILAVSLFGAYRASQQVPDFYQEALQLEPARQQEAGDELEKQVLQLHNQTRQEGRWRAVFTDQQINGWLAADLPRKFPQMLPGGVKDPRVAIHANQALVAWRYEDSKMTTVVSLTLELYLTDEPNVVAVRVRKARAGLLPLPLAQFLDGVAGAARKADIALSWAQTDGDPVALVTIPAEHEEYMHRMVRLERLELRKGELVLAGRTEGAGDSLRRAGAQQAALNHSAEKKTRHL